MSPELTKLLFGPYYPPRLHVGDKATCLLRDGDVIITSWTAARIPWPRCRAIGKRGGGFGLLLDEELARAVHRALVNLTTVSIPVIAIVRRILVVLDLD